MPRLDAAALDSSDSMDTMGFGAFQFSGAKLERLEELSAEYVIATIVLDVSGSVSPYIDEIQDMARAVVATAKKDPNRSKILLRVLTFGTHVEEIIGFKPVLDVDEDSEINLSINGMTALYDGAQDALQATESYTKHLYNADFIINGLVIIITDGAENASRHATNSSLHAVATRLKNPGFEELESMAIIAVGVGSSMSGTSLATFGKQLLADEAIDAKDFSEETIKRIGNFISESISSASQAVGSGGPSKIASF